MSRNEHNMFYAYTPEYYVHGVKTVYISFDSYAEYVKTPRSECDDKQCSTLFISNFRSHTSATKTYSEYFISDYSEHSYSISIAVKGIKCFQR
jgi:hypothetical protein